MHLKDQLGREFSIEEYPKRIVSLVPSITELLFYLGVENEIVGITKFCVHPAEMIKHKVKVGGTKSLKINLIKKLNSDLIIANKEENVQDQIGLLMNFSPTWISDVNTFQEAFEMIDLLGECLDKNREAGILIEKIKNSFLNLNVGLGKSFIYFIWNEPKYIVGQNTFIHSMLETVGFRNACSRSRYPEWNGEEAEIVFLSSEPFPFKKKHQEEFQQLFPKSKIVLIDGEMCSWYGSRMLLAADYFSTLQID